MAEFATLVLKADTTGLAKGRKEIEQTTQAANKNEQATGKMAAGFNKAAMAAAALGAAAVVAVGSLAFRGAIREAEQLERNMLRTNAIITATGGAAGKTAKQLHEQARALALTTLASTEGVMKAQQTLLTFRNIRGQVFDDAIKGAMDLAAAMGTDLNSATLQLAKALEDPVKGMSALTRSGTVFTDAQKEMVKGMVAVGDTAKAQQFILGELAAQYGGVAAREAAGFAGAQDTLAQKTQEFLLALNDMLGLTKIVQGAFTAMADLLQAITDKMVGLTNAVSSLFAMGDATKQLAAASDTANLAIADEIAQVNALMVASGQSVVLSQIAALNKLREAEAHLASADAKQKEARATVMNSEAYQGLIAQISDTQAALQGMNKESALGAAAYEETEQSLVAMLNRQKELLALIPQTSSEYAAAAAEVEKLRAAIARSGGEAVVLNEAVSGAADTTAALARLANGITYSNAVAGAQALAERLQVSLHAAMQMMGLLGAAQQAATTAAVFDPRDPRFSSAENHLAKIRETMKQVASEAQHITKWVPKASAAIGGSGGSAKAAAKELKKAATEAEGYDAALAGAALTAEDLGTAKANILTGGIDSVSNAFGDFVARGFKDFKGFAKSILSTFTGMLSQMIALAAKNRIMVGLGISAGGAGGAAAAGQPGGGGGIVSSVIGKSLGGLVGTWGGTGGILGGLSGAVSGLTTGGIGGALSSIGTSLSGAFSGVAGFGAALGALAGPIAIAVAAISFFKKKVTELDRGINFAAENMAISIEGYKKINTKRFWGLSSKDSVEAFDGYDAGIPPMIKAANEIQTGIVDAAAALGIGAEAFDNFSYSFQSSFKDMTDEQIQAELTEKFRQLGHDFAVLIPGLEGLTKEGELASDTLYALVNSLNTVNGTFELLGLSMQDASLSLIHI